MSITTQWETDTLGIEMDRSPFTMWRAVLLGIIAVSLSACGDGATETAPPTPAYPKIKLRVASEFQTSMPVLGTTITRLARRLKTASSEMVMMNVDEPGENVPKLESLGAVSEGKVDAAYAAAGYWAGKLPAAPLFSSVPYGPEASEYLAWMYQGNGLKLYQTMYDRSGYHVKVLICAIIPPETSGWFAQPINSVADLRGLNMRFYGLGGRVMEKLGVAVTMISPAEIFQALERGRIDATEYSLPTIDQKLGFHSIVKYNYFPGWHQQATIAELLVNKTVWENLSSSQRMLIELACADSVVNSLAEGEGTQFHAMRENESKYGVTNKYWSEEMLETFRIAWNSVAEEQCASDPFFKEVYEDLQTFRRNYDLWERNAFLPRAPRD